MNDRLGTRLGSALLATLALHQADADNTLPPPSEGLFLKELPTVLSVTRLVQPVTDTPAAVTALDRELIAASGVREISALFRLVPGMQVGEFSGNQHSVTIHGMTDQFSRRMQVLVDGRSVYSPITGGVEWRDLPLVLEDIERIEVIRGPNAATHGANAFLGVISITTRHAAEAAGTELKLTTGTRDVEDGLLRHAGRVGPLDYRLTVARQVDDGFRNTYDDSSSRIANLRVDYQAGLSDEFSLQAGYNDGSREEGFLKDPSFIRNELKNHSRFLQADWRHRWNAHNSTRAQLYYTDHSSQEALGRGLDLAPGVTAETFIQTLIRTGAIDTDLLQVTPRDFRSEARRTDLEVSHTTGDPDRWRLVVGGSLRRDAVRAPVYLEEDDARVNRLRRLFANLEVRPTSRVTVNAGVMGENSDITGEALSPRIAFNLQTWPGQALRVGWSRAYRTPVIVENDASMFLDTDPLKASLAPEVARINALLATMNLPSLSLPDLTIPMFISPGDLEKEKITSREVGYVADFPGLRLSADLRYYHDRLDDLVDTIKVRERGLEFFTFENADRASVHGWELNLDWRPDTNSRLWFSYGSAHPHSNDPRVARSTPEHTATLLGLYRFPRDLTASATYYWVSDHAWLGDGSKEQPYIHRLDLRLAKAWRVGESRVQLTAVAQSLGNENLHFLTSPNRPDERNAIDNRALVTLGIQF